jgi:hypothetical protein
MSLGRTMAWYLLVAGAACATGACSDVLGIEERSFTPAGTLCEQYCTATEACTEQFKLYASREVCLATCAQMPQGTASDKTGNTVGCRLNQALEVPKIGEPDIHCPAAGPGGDGACGSNCDGFCAVMLPVCGGEYYEDEQQCLADCANVPEVGIYNIGVPQENSIQCRLYHLTSATLDKTHCEHAGGRAKCIEMGSGGAGGTGTTTGG